MVYEITQTFNITKGMVITMASKWKYANLDARHRLDLLRKGNKELFDEEVARTKEITKARRELGLDTSEQENWMDTVGYNYSLSSASENDKISKNGYAALYLEDKKADSEPSGVKAYRDGAAVKTSYISSAKRKIDNAKKLAMESAADGYEKIKEDAKQELYSRYPYLEEELVNEGASLRGGKAARARKSIDDRLTEIYEELDRELENKLSELEKKYAALRDTITEYRRNGTAKESLGVIANVLVKNAAREDGFDASLVPGVSQKRYPKNATETETGTISGTDVIGTQPETDVSDTDSVNDTENRQIKHPQSTSEDLSGENEVLSDKEMIETVDVPAGGYDKELYAETDELSQAVLRDREAAVRSIREMLVKNGMSASKAAIAAARLAELLARRKTGA